MRERKTVPLTRRLRATIAVAALAAALLAPSAARAASPFDGDGMWIWYVARAGGSANAIAKKAKRYGIETVFIKSSDGGNWWWSQFPRVAGPLKQKGIHVCAWQYVYGKHPRAEADLGARAVKTGASCLVIDAEAEYEGRYKAARTYIGRLRAKIGPSFPLALAGFPYVDFHPSFPYSVFFGPGAAQWNLPQMYQKAIGVSVPTVFQHTYRYNGVYGRRIRPLGQTFMNPPKRDIVRFRNYARRYGAGGVSWWSWQHTKPYAWRAVAEDLKPLSGKTRGALYPGLRSGSRGDLVVWAQQHLKAFGHDVAVTGFYSARTRNAVKAFQAKHGLKVDGKIGPATWKPLLLAPGFAKRPKGKRTISAAVAAALDPPTPRSARLPAKRYEIPPKPGRRGG